MYGYINWRNLKYAVIDLECTKSVWPDIARLLLKSLSNEDQQSVREEKRRNFLWIWK